MKRLDHSGQTIIALLIFMLLGIMITTSAVAITVINTQANNSYAIGELALQNAETGAENAMEQLERNPSYTGETMTFSTGNTATITVSGSGTKTITSLGASGTFRRTIVVTATYASNVITLTSWVETP